eukprot:359804-Chlamydomonas_euryale.AAC.2
MMPACPSHTRSTQCLDPHDAPPRTDPHSEPMRARLAPRRSLEPGGAVHEALSRVTAEPVAREPARPPSRSMPARALSSLAVPVSPHSPHSQHAPHAPHAPLSSHSPGGSRGQPLRPTDCAAVWRQARLQTSLSTPHMHSSGGSPPPVGRRAAGGKAGGCDGCDGGCAACLGPPALSAAHAERVSCGEHAPCASRASCGTTFMNSGGGGRSDGIGSGCGGQRRRVTSGSGGAGSGGARSADGSRRSSHLESGIQFRGGVQGVGGGDGSKGYMHRPRVHTLDCSMTDFRPRSRGHTLPAQQN